MLSYFRARASAAALVVLCSGIFAAVFSLYGLAWQAALYGGALCLVAVAAFWFSDFRRYREKRALLHEMVNEVTVSLDRLPAPGDEIEEGYQALLRALFDDAARQKTEAAAQLSGMVEYYTLWAHQIKTPIAAQRLLLEERELDARALSAELFRIEQYVEMALCYLRLDSESTDFVLREVDLDGVIRQALRKYATLFIRGKISLQYEPLGARALTDEKWLLFVVEQVLSNAVKYAPGGTISIRLEAPTTVVIEDDGIGIAPEDLPRVFENGYTGLNGRYDKRATGIGLYLCRRVMRKLGHGISITSTPGAGTAVRLALDSKPLKVD